MGRNISDIISTKLTQAGYLNIRKRKTKCRMYR